MATIKKTGQGTTATRRKRTRPSGDETAIEATCQSLLETLERDQRDFATLSQVGLNTEVGKEACRRLVSRSLVVAVGNIGRSPAYAATLQRAPDERLEQIAESKLLSLVTTELMLFPLSGDSKRYRGIPAKVREKFRQVLLRLVTERRAFKLKALPNQVALAANLRAVLTNAPAEPSSTTSAETKHLRADPPARRGDGHIDRDAVLRAYDRLSRDRRSPNIVISELREQAQVPLEPFKAWLLGECKADRATPLLGEPAHASKEQLDAALLIQGQPHLYVRFEREVAP